MNNDLTRWQIELLTLKPTNSWSTLTKKFYNDNVFPGCSEEQVYNRIRGFYRRHKDDYDEDLNIKPNKEDKIEEVVSADNKKEKTVDIMELLTKGLTLNEMSEVLEKTKKECVSFLNDLEDQGYNIIAIDDVYKISKIVIPSLNKSTKTWNGDKVIRFGLIGDTQINSKYTQITHLHTMYDIFKAEGITQVYHTGDIDEGLKMRKGHEYEIYNQSADDHVEEIIKVYPHIEGITTDFIIGNHDASIIKQAGYNIGIRIGKDREDMNYLGADQAIIELTPNCSLELRHPGDGTSYAFSYKLQKIVEAMSGGEKPNILAVGHYHKTEYIFIRNVHCFQTGCFQSQTPWMRGKSIAAHMGGWIVEVHVDEEGTITRIKPEFIPFYKAIKDDYKSWR